MGALHGLFGGQAGEFGHQADEVHAGHAGDEGIVFRHVAEQAADVLGFGADVFAEDAGGAGGGLVEAEQGVDERRLSGAVGAKQADGAAGERAIQFFENGSLAEADFEIVEFDYGLYLVLGGAA